MLKTTVYVVTSDRSELTRVWKVVEDRFGAIRPPSTLLGVSMVGYRNRAMGCLTGAPAAEVAAECARVAREDVAVRPRPPRGHHR